MTNVQRKGGITGLWHGARPAASVIAAFVFVCLILVVGFVG